MLRRNRLSILLTNDDGYEAEGISALEAELSRLGKVFVVAPYEEKSGVSQALTIHQPIRLFEISRNLTALTGTPADCVIFALRKLLRKPPDLVVSGINHGANLGDDILYSGTVAAAREAAVHGIPSFAFSQVISTQEPDFKRAAVLAAGIVADFYPEHVPPGSFLNVNFPENLTADYRFTRQGCKHVSTSIEEKHDPRGRRYYWIGKDESRWIVEPDTDYEAIQGGAVSITPLWRDQTDYAGLQRFNESRQELKIR